MKTRGLENEGWFTFIISATVQRMRGLCISIFFILALFAYPRTVAGQGVVYVSNLSEPLAGWNIGNGNQGFVTGTASGGYMLNSITLLMGNWGGDASNFNVSVYSSVDSQSGVFLGALNGNPDPEAAGEYVYGTAGLALQPTTEYWIVATGDSWSTGSIMPPGGYCWQLSTSVNYKAIDGWSINNSGGQFPQVFQFAINATEGPEPDEMTLLGLGAVGFLFLCCARARSARTGV